MGLGMDEPIRILCVDDERNVLRALERLFLDEDYEILCALSGEEGVARLEREAGIQVVISDYRMPGMNGVDFLRRVTDRWPRTVRIVLSGYADAASVVAAINEGQIYKFIPKPWNDDELRVTIRNALEKYSLEKRNHELLEELRVANENLCAIIDSLEATVAERTAKLTLQNRALRISQTILHTFPFAVLGFETGGTLVQCNQAGFELFGKSGVFPWGRPRRELLPPDLNAMMDDLPGSACLCAPVLVGGREYSAWITHFKEKDQEGLILVLQPREYRP